MAHLPLNQAKDKPSQRAEFMETVSPEIPPLTTATQPSEYIKITKV
jgi:hypothetical protein